MRKVYLVCWSHGEYSERTEGVSCGFDDEEDATRCVKTLEAINKFAQAVRNSFKFEQFDRSLYSIANYVLPKSVSYNLNHPDKEVRKKANQERPKIAEAHKTELAEMEIKRNAAWDKFNAEQLAKFINHAKAFACDNIEIKNYVIAEIEKSGSFNLSNMDYSYYVTPVDVLDSDQSSRLSDMELARIGKA